MRSPPAARCCRPPADATEVDNADGSLIATIGRDRALGLLDAATGDLQHRIRVGAMHHEGGHAVVGILTQGDDPVRAAPSPHMAGPSESPSPLRTPTGTTTRIAGGERGSTSRWEAAQPRSSSMASPPG